MGEATAAPTATPTARAAATKTTRRRPCHQEKGGHRAKMRARLPRATAGMNEWRQKDDSRAPRPKHRQAADAFEKRAAATTNKL